MVKLSANEAFVPDLLDANYRRVPARVQQSSPVRMRVASHDGRSVYGLLYLAAVRSLASLSLDGCRLTARPYRLAMREELT